jgi:hypothetical protein
MRDKWYGDNRDLVKWGVLLTLAERYGLKHILQVLYYRPTEWAQLTLDGEQVPLPPAIIQHFRWVGAVLDLKAPVRIEVISNAFVDRQRYHSDLIEQIRGRSVTPGIVFLDPDTGLQPQRPSLKHVLDRELADLWCALQAGDFLVLYQHQTNRNARSWIPDKKKQFARAIGLPIGAVKLGRSEEIARDVVLFYAQKAG